MKPTTGQEGGKWDFPLVLPKSPWKRALKQSLGRALLLARPSMGRRIEAAGETHSFLEEVALAGLIARHRAHGTLDQLAHFHKAFWTGRHAVEFHATHEYRFREQFLKQHVELVEQLEAVLQGNPALRTLYELGCGSGLVIDHLATRLPTLQRLVGIDLSSEQTEINKERYKANTRLSFHAGDGGRWMRDHAEPGGVLFVYGGVLEYFTEPALSRLFMDVASKAPSCIALAEPIGQSFDLVNELHSVPYGSEFSFSHNYPYLVSQAGFRVRWQSDIGSRWVLLVATKDAEAARPAG